MSSLADSLIDRRVLRKALTRWRLAAIVAALVALVAVVALVSGYRAGWPVGDHVARVSINGFISGDRATLEMLDRIARSNRVKAVIVTIASPGGTVPGSEALFESLRKLAARKPTVALVTSMAASGGYIAALGTDRIFAQQTALVGSIGVLFQFPEFSKLLDTVGVKMEQIKSAPLKAEPSGFAPTSEAARAALGKLVADTFVWFKDLVRSRRGIDGAALETVSDGRVFMGRQALDLRLIDALGGETEVLDWLVQEKRIARRLPVRNWRPTQGTPSLLNLSAGVLRYIGLDNAAEAVATAAETQDYLARSGLLAVWQPAVEK
jgi:protease-4